MKDWHVVALLLVLQVLGMAVMAIKTYISCAKIIRNLYDSDAIADPVDREAYHRRLDDMSSPFIANMALSTWAYFPVRVEDAWKPINVAGYVVEHTSRCLMITFPNGMFIAAAAVTFLRLLPIVLSRNVLALAHQSQRLQHMTGALAAAK